MPKPKSVDAYLAKLGDDERAALKRLRKAIRAAAPAAEECISYGMPAFRYNGRVFVWFRAASKHCSFFPGAHPIAALAKELRSYDTSKGTVRFTPEKPLPLALIRKLVKARLKEYAEKRSVKAVARGIRE